MGPVLETALGYVDDVATLGDRDQDLVELDVQMAAFERASGAILNRNRKSVIVGLGTWESREDWPVPWLQVAKEVKLYGISITASFKSTVDRTWDRVLGGLEQVLRLWSARDLPTLKMRARALEVFGLSKLWYAAQVIPLTKKHQVRAQAAAGAFLWRGSLERLAYRELHRSPEQGGLSLTCLATRAEALLVKQACHRLEQGGNPRGHLAYWLGISLRHHIPQLREGLNAEVLPGHWANLARLLKEALEMDCVDANSLGEVRAKELYQEWMTTPPPPKVEFKWQLSWGRVWARLAWTGLPAGAVDLAFRAIHNILPLEARRHRLALVDSPQCNSCGAQEEDTLHFFTACTRVQEAWEDLVHRASAALGQVPTDRDLLFLNIPSGQGEGPTVLTVICYIEMAWKTRGEPGVLRRRAVEARVRSVKWAFPGLY